MYFRMLFGLMLFRNLTWSRSWFTIVYHGLSWFIMVVYLGLPIVSKLQRHPVVYHGHVAILGSPVIEPDSWRAAPWHLGLWTSPFWDDSSDYPCFLWVMFAIKQQTEQIISTWSPIHRLILDLSPFISTYPIYIFVWYGHISINSPPENGWILGNPNPWTVDGKDHKEQLRPRHQV